MPAFFPHLNRFAGHFFIIIYSAFSIFFGWLPRRTASRPSRTIKIAVLHDYQ